MWDLIRAMKNVLSYLSPDSVTPAPGFLPSAEKARKASGETTED